MIWCTMQTKVEKIKDLLKATEQEYDKHTIFRNNVAQYELVEKNRYLYSRIITLKQVVKLLEE